MKHINKKIQHDFHLMLRKFSLRQEHLMFLNKIDIFIVLTNFYHTFCPEDEGLLPLKLRQMVKEKKM